MTEKNSLIAKFADRYSIDPTRLLETLKQTAFKQADGQPISTEQMAWLLVIADQYHLNPFTREIYAFPNKNNGRDCTDRRLGRMGADHQFSRHFRRPGIQGYRRDQPGRQTQAQLPGRDRMHHLPQGPRTPYPNN